MKSIKKLLPVADQIRDKFEHGKLIELIDKEFDTYVIDGKTIIRGKSDDEFIDYVLMGDQYFYNNWITQFAINQVAGKNYFDLATWSSLTDRLTKGVIVVHEETKQFLFHIPKFIEPQYSSNAKGVVDRLCSLASTAKFQQGTVQAETIKAFAEHLSYVAENDVANEGLTSLIPAAIYEFYDIVPKAMKAIIYIRDHYKTIDVDDEKKFNQALEILKNYFKGKSVSITDKHLILSLTDDEFIFEDGEEINNSIFSSGQDDIDYNPLED